MVIGHGHRSPVTGYRLPVTSHQSPVTGHRSPVTGHRSMFTLSYRVPPMIPWLQPQRRPFSSWQIDVLNENKFTTRKPQHLLVTLFWTLIFSTGAIITLWFGDWSSAFDLRVGLAWHLRISVYTVVIASRIVAGVMTVFTAMTLYFSTTRTVAPPVFLTERMRTLLGLPPATDEELEAEYKAGEAMRREFLTRPSPPSNVAPQRTRQLKPVTRYELPPSVNRSPTYNIQSSTPKRLSLPARSPTEGEIYGGEALDTFLNQRREWEENMSPDRLASGGLSSSYVGYSPPYRIARMNYQSQLQVTGPCDLEAAEELLVSLGITNDDMAVGTELLRRWISDNIVCPLVSLMGMVNDELVRGMPWLQATGVPIVTILDPSGSDAMKSQGYMLQNVMSNPVFMRISQYLDVRGASSHDYLIHRISELGQGGSLPHFKWNGGSTTWRTEWNNDHPTDSSLVMHLFATYMDQILPSDPAGRPFTDRYFVRDAHNDPMTSRSCVKIQQTSIHPPHFKLLVNGGRNETSWDTIPGRYNVFHAIQLFLVYLKRERNGFLEQVDLGSALVDNLIGVLRNV